MLDVWTDGGGDPWKLQLSWEGLGEIAWANRQRLLALAEREDGTTHAGRRTTGRGCCRPGAARQLTLAEVRHLGLAIPWAEARVRPFTSGRAAWLPARVELTEELLWLLGLWVAEGSSHRSDRDAFLTISNNDETLLALAGKVFERDLGLHVVRQDGSSARSASLFVHSRLLLALWDHLGFDANRKRIPGWLLGLPKRRLKWFIEGYRRGDGVHSGQKFDEASVTSSRPRRRSSKDDLVVALARFGLVASVGRYDPRSGNAPGERRYPFWRLTLPSVGAVASAGLGPRR